MESDLPPVKPPPGGKVPPQSRNVASFSAATASINSSRGVSFSALALEGGGSKWSKGKVPEGGCAGSQGGCFGKEAAVNSPGAGAQKLCGEGVRADSLGRRQL